MPLSNAGTVVFSNAIVGTSYTPFNHSNSYIGVGDSLAAFSVTQTDLQASTNKLRKPMDSSFPTISGVVLTFQGTFNPSDANYDWNEWGVFDSSSGGIMLTRKIGYLGTKTNTQTWVLQGIITVNNPLS